MSDSIEDEILNQLTSIVSEATNSIHKKLTLETTAYDVPGWDSIAHSRIMLLIEDHYGFKIDDDLMFSFANVGALCDHIGHHIKTQEPLSSAAASHQPALEVPQMKSPVFALFSDARYAAPFSMFHDKPSSLSGGKIDKNGFLNKLPPARKKPSNEKRIFIFGNSAIRESNIVTYIEDEFLRQGRNNIKVFNFGIISGNLYQSLMYLLFEGLDMQPDLVVHYDCFIEIVHAMMYDPRPGYPYNQYMLEIIHEHLGAGTINEMDFIREESKRRDDIREQVKYRTAEWMSSAAGSYLDAARKLHKLCDAYKISATTILQVSLSFKKVRTGPETEYVGPFWDQVRAGLLCIKEGLVEMEGSFDPKNHSFEDMTAFFKDRQDQCFKDFVHIATENHDKAIAIEIFNKIQKMI